MMNQRQVGGALPRRQDPHHFLNWDVTDSLFSIPWNEMGFTDVQDSADWYSVWPACILFFYVPDLPKKFPEVDGALWAVSVPRLTEYVTNFSLALGLIGGNRRVGVVYHCRLNLLVRWQSSKFELKFYFKFYAILELISKIIDC